jgi:hypothetical protein
VSIRDDSILGAAVRAARIDAHSLLYVCMQVLGMHVCVACTGLHRLQSGPASSGSHSQHMRCEGRGGMREAGPVTHEEQHPGICWRG